MQPVWNSTFQEELRDEIQKGATDMEGEWDWNPHCSQSIQEDRESEVTQVCILKTSIFPKRKHLVCRLKFSNLTAAFEVKIAIDLKAI